MSSTPAAGSNRRPGTPPPARAAKATASAMAAAEKSGSIASASTAQSAPVTANRRGPASRAAATSSATAPIRRGAGPPDSGPRWIQRRAPAARTPRPGANTASAIASAARKIAGAAANSRRVPRRATTAPSAVPQPRLTSCRAAKCAGAPNPAAPGRAGAAATIISPSAPSPAAGTINNDRVSARRPIGSELKRHARAEVEEVAQEGIARRARGVGRVAEDQRVTGAQRDRRVVGEDDVEPGCAPEQRLHGVEAAGTEHQLGGREVGDGEPGADPHERPGAPAAPGGRLQEREAGLGDDPLGGEGLLLPGRDHGRAAHAGLPLVVEEVDRGAQLEAVRQGQVAPLVAAADGDAVGRPDHVGLVAEATPPPEVDADDVVGDRYRGRRRGHQGRRRGRVGGRLRGRRLSLCPQRSENGRREHRPETTTRSCAGTLEGFPPLPRQTTPGEAGLRLRDHAREPSKGSRPSRDRLRPAKPGSVYAIMRGNPRRVRAPSRDRLRPAKPGSVYAIMRGNPRRVRAPSRDRLRPAKPGSVYA